MKLRRFTWTKMFPLVGLVGATGLPLPAMADKPAAGDATSAIAGSGSGEAEVASKPESPVAPRPTISGIDKSLFSETVTAGDNFYHYANAVWLNETHIPADKSNYGIFTVLDDRTREQVRKLIETAAAQQAEPGTPAQKVGDLYRSFLNLGSRNAAGIRPLGEWLEKVAAVDSPESLATVAGELSRLGVYGPFACYVSVDAKNSDRYAVYLTQSGLTLPDRDYYLEDEPRYVTLRSQLKDYIAKILGQAAVVTDPVAASGVAGKEKFAEALKAAAGRVFAIEERIARGHWTKTANRDPDATYNSTTPTDLAEMLGGFAWSPFAAAIGIQDQAAVVVRQPTYVSGLGEFFTDFTLEDWKNYYHFKLVDTYATALSEPLEKLHFDFHSTAVTGITEQEPLWKRGVAKVDSVVGELTGQLYVESHFPAEAKKRMNVLVENLKAAFSKRIESRDWMGEGTKRQAAEKLGKFTTKIGYPDEWKDYSELSITPDSLVKNLIASAKFEFARDLAKLGQPIDRNEWHMTPQTINAYYNPTMNEIVFPAAILQPPFFNMQADDAVNYGAIGAVIGHELSHGFDDKGSKYDGDGNLRKWWTPKDRAEFERRSRRLVDQYNAFEPVDGMNVNGELTLGENIGDLGGLSVTYEAFKLSTGEADSPVIDGLSGDQRFFLGWAQIWRRLYRDQELRRRLIVDPHSPSEYRVNGIVRNIDAWYEAFDVTKDSELYLPAEQRVRIW